jgi:hypothetical protein
MHLEARIQQDMADLAQAHTSLEAQTHLVAVGVAHTLRAARTHPAQEAAAVGTAQAQAHSLQAAQRDPVGEVVDIHPMVVDTHPVAEVMGAGEPHQVAGNRQEAAAVAVLVWGRSEWSRFVLFNHQGAIEAGRSDKTGGGHAHIF